MPITGTYGRLVEKTEKEALVDSPGKFLRPRSETIGPLPDDKPIALVGIATATLMDATQRSALEAAIEAITGVQKAVVLIDGKTPAAGRVPATHELHFRVEGQLTLREVPA